MCGHCRRSLLSSTSRRWGCGTQTARQETALQAIVAEDKTGIDAEKVGALQYKPDEESWQDVMAFKGPGPEVHSELECCSLLCCVPVTQPRQACSA